MALATSMTVPVVDALLMFSLMIGPAAAARSLTARPSLGFFVGVIGAAFFLVGKAWSWARGKSENTVRPASRSLR
jgi:zinc/manganese transport system permease protein